MQTIAKKQYLVSESKSYTLEEYLLRERKSTTKHFYTHGKITKMAGASFKHNLIATNILTEIVTQIRRLNKPFIALNSDQKIYAPAFEAILYPDALVLTQKPEFYKEHTDLITNPLVVIEVLSERTRKYDKFDKFYIYQSIPSFQEYILIEQNKQEIESWFKVKPDTWEKKTHKTELEVRALAFGIPVADIYRGVE